MANKTEVDRILTNSYLQPEIYKELSKNKKEKCQFIIYNLLKLHHHSITTTPVIYLRDFFQTERCDQFLSMSTPNKSVHSDKNKQQEQNPAGKEIIATEPEGFCELRYNRAKYLNKLGKDTLEKVLEERKLTTEEIQNINFFTAHYYEWNRKCLQRSLWTIDKCKWLSYLVEQPQNNAVVGGIFLIAGVILSGFLKPLLQPITRCILSKIKIFKSGCVEQPKTK